MDHLPLPQVPMDQIKVPLLSTIDYDGGDITTYPDREGWGTRTVLEWQCLFSNPPPEFAAFLQRWLYFGLLQTVFGVKINVLSTFVSKDSTENYPIMTSENLVSLARRYRSMFSKRMITVECTLNMVQAVSVVGSMHQLLTSNRGWKRTGGYIYAEETIMKFILTEQPDDPRDARISIATTLALEFVGECLRASLWEAKDYRRGMQKLEQVHAAFGEELQFRLDSGSSQPGFLNPIWNLLRKKGWCPAQTQPMFSEFTSAGLVYMNNIDRPSPWEIHHMIVVRGEMDEKESHVSTDNLCKPHQCRYRQLSDLTYKTKHTESCPGCPDIVADLDHLCAILEGGGIPLIQVIDSEWEGSEIQLIEAEPGMAYVAISHVWSDGLGNVDRNALCRCQLIRLSRLVGDLPHPAENIVLFWLDTICVPPDNAKRDNAQLNALQMMRQTYEDATAVLVLDSWLLSCATQEKSDTEILMRIFNSLWNRRLWTYQEGALAHFLLFQFRDHAYELDSAINRLSTNIDLALNLTLKSSLLARYHSLRSFRDSKSTRIEKLDAIFSALKFRTTSVASDEALCLSALLGLDIQRIANAPDNPLTRMEEFWRMNNTVPASVLFYGGATLSTKGLRWAPQTLLLSSKNFSRETGVYESLGAMSSSHFTVATRTDEGISIRLPGFIARIGEHVLGSQLNVKDQYGNYFGLSLCLSSSNKNTKEFMEDQNGTFRSTAGISIYSVYGKEEIAFVHMIDENNPGVKHNKLIENNEEFHYGFLAVVMEKRDDTLVLEKICMANKRVFKQRNDSAIIQVIEKAYPGNQPYGGWVMFDKRNGIAVSTVVDTKSREQMWIIN